jgi:mannose-6-phosphate isomerase class I
MIENDRWKELIRVHPIKKGDFFQIDPGTVHAIMVGTVLLETQQSSDITYRLYDYGRLDHGNPRELHIERSIDVIRCPHVDNSSRGSTTNQEAYDLEELISCSFYTVLRIKIHGEHTFVQNDEFLNVSVIDGCGEIDGIHLRKGDHFIIPSEYGDYTLKGDMELIVSHL